MRELLTLYSKHSVHGEEWDVITYIRDWIEDHGVGTEIIDGNLVVTNSKCNLWLSAHADQVFTNGKASHFLSDGDVISGYTDNFQRTSLGADDKNGIWIIMKMIESGRIPNIIISYGEEVGLLGIRDVIGKIKFKDDDYCIVLDRRGFGQVLSKGCGSTYAKNLGNKLIEFLGNGFYDATGTVSDANVISEYIETVNMSVGYYNAHTPREYTSFTELQWTLDSIKSVYDDFKYEADKDWRKHGKEVPSYGRWKSGSDDKRLERSNKNRTSFFGLWKRI